MAILSTIKKVLPYIKTATGYVLCRLSSQAVEMDDGTTLQESYDSLNSKISGSAGILVYGGYKVLRYQASDNLEAQLPDVPVDVINNPSNYIITLTMQQISATPYGQVSQLTYEVRKNTMQFVVHAWGDGFVSGHVLGVSVGISKLF